MNLLLVRNTIGKTGCFGIITDTQGHFLWVTAEHAFEQPDGSWEPLIPNGDYNCIFGNHTLAHGQEIETYMLENVPGHTSCLIHVGNYPQTDSDGCILIAKRMGFMLNMNKMICDSRNAFNDFIKLQNGSASFTLSIS